MKLQAAIVISSILLSCVETIADQYPKRVPFKINEPLGNDLSLQKYGIEGTRSLCNLFSPGPNETAKI